MSKIWGLVVNNVGGLSLGRTAFWLFGLLALWRFYKGEDVTDHHFILVLTLMGYQWTGKLRVPAKLKDMTFEDLTKDPPSPQAQPPGPAKPLGPIGPPTMKKEK
jgi:hypothetical protein